MSFFQTTNATVYVKNPGRVQMMVRQSRLLIEKGVDKLAWPNLASLAVQRGRINRRGLVLGSNL